MSVYRSLHRSFRALSRRQALACALLMAGAFACALLVTIISGRPQPGVHDEFSNLLAADTFSQGRLANPPHPMWVFFESMHIIHQPAYASMYPPGQGAAMATGQVLAGDPIVGVWLSVAAMCGATYWMLLGWLPPRWALLGGILVLFKYVTLGRVHEYGTGGYWSQSYWGGAVAAMGGAILFGALGRLRKGPPRIGHGIALALGASVLCNSRPFEGVLVTLPVALWLLLRLMRLDANGRTVMLRQVVLPAAIVMGLNFAFVATYNLRVTGQVTKLPWQHHHDQYCTFPIFVWQQPKPSDSVSWNHRELQIFHDEWEVSLWKSHQSAWDASIQSARKLRNLAAFYLASVPRFDQQINATADRVPIQRRTARWLMEVFGGMSISEIFAGLILLSPLVALPIFALRRRAVLPVVACVLVVCGNLITVATFPHYAAPATAALILTYLGCLRLCRARRSLQGRLQFNLVIGMTALAFAASFFSQGRSSVIPDGSGARPRILSQLTTTDETHLVFVRYPTGHYVHRERVYNDADIDGAKVVWARDMGEKNQELIDYFKDRRVWLLEVSNVTIEQQLQAYPQRHSPN